LNYAEGFGGFHGREYEELAALHERVNVRVAQGTREEFDPVLQTTTGQRRVYAGCQWAGSGNEEGRARTLDRVEKAGNTLVVNQAADEQAKPLEAHHGVCGY